MKILWINPSFLDYRIPVYEALNRLTGGNFHILFSADLHRTPERVTKKIEEVLGKNAIGLRGEKILKIGKDSSDFANKVLNVPYQPKLFSTAMSIDADIVIVEGFFQWAPAGYLKKILQKTPIVLSYERTFYTERNASFFRKFYRKFITKFFINSAIVNGVMSEEYIASLGISPKNIVTGGMSADSAMFRTQTELLNKDECKKLWSFEKDIVFLYVGQIIERKGIIQLLQAWKRFHKKCLLVCAGDGEKMSEAKLYIEKNKLENVKMLGTVEYDSLPSLYKAADVFIIPTLEDNWSLVVPEAMASGLPIACSKYNGCWPELVKDELNGKVFDPLNKDETLECLEYFYEHQSELENMGQQSILIEQEYSPENAAKNIMKACKISVGKLN